VPPATWRPWPDWKAELVGKLLLVTRLIARDLRRRPVQALLFVLAITAATATLTLGLVLHGVTSHPYQQTRAATKGPDVVAYVPAVPPASPRPGHPLQPPSQTAALIGMPGVTGHSEPYPLITAVIQVRGLTAGAVVEGRDQAPVLVDQPKLTAGSWVRPGGVVIERAFATALDVGVGDRVILNGRAFTVAGIAVTAAHPPYPVLCLTEGGGCGYAGNFKPDDVGLIWMLNRDGLGLVTPRMRFTTTCST